MSNKAAKLPSLSHPHTPLLLVFHRLYNRLCVGTTGMVVKGVGALAAAVVVYIVGYVTGYYVHKC